MARNTTSGQSSPLGSTWFYGLGVNFSLYSKHARAVELLLFDSENADGPSEVIHLDRLKNRSGHYWHIFVHGLRAGQLYGWRVDGPFLPEHGLRFDRQKVLLDPYGKAVMAGSCYSRQAAVGEGDNSATCMKSVVSDRRGYDWEGDRPLERPFGDTIIYEMHVGGFTKNPNSGVSPEKRGTYAGVIEKIPYLKELGVTAVELLPVFQFDEQECPPGLSNYWGYSPVSFFSPHRGYSSDKSPLGPQKEFRDMVKALHRAGIEVILDVVFNHTAEGDERGPTFCFKGLANDLYYILEEDRASFRNYSGCGNTLNAYQSIVRRLVIDSLHFWVEEMHVDGFRFDLASILARDENGNPLQNPPLLWSIDTDPALAGTKLIAEAWDAGGLYQVGNFAGDRWKEWNGQFRDDVRQFVKGDRGMVPKITSRLFASPDIYLHRDREPEQSINFITCHDGFTLNDLVSYDRKHNEANREDNRDGCNENYSWNCGVEGPTDDPEINALRMRQMKNLMALNLVSVGAPMLLMGDEVQRTQQGNNNAYCQDSELNWFDWSLVERNREMFNFVQALIAMRRARPLSRLGAELSLAEFLHHANIQWHGTKLFEPDWGKDSRSIAFSLIGIGEERSYHVILNAYWEPLEFELPPVHREESCWHRVIDTALAPPEDVYSFDKGQKIHDTKYLAAPRSFVMFQAYLNPAGPGK